ncbi:hypothetical protein JOD01_003399 [Brevibacillus fulvus]|uniref:Uncharacterized protein n=1 Tax=Brevibacillus fulvus TaxID=1125967 RepID=A0A938Y229_9BACL|nr:hypothetical protein [Brevibacillus fulvus]
MFGSNETKKAKYRWAWIIPFAVLVLLIAWFVFYIL